MTTPNVKSGLIVPMKRADQEKNCDLKGLGQLGNSDHGFVLPRPAPLPICPPPTTGESLTSWIARIAHRTDTPLGLLIHRLGLAPTSYGVDMPNGYGGLTPGLWTRGVITRRLAA